MRRPEELDRRQLDPFICKRLSRADGARAFICGISGTGIEPDEAAFLRETDPFGLILFKRNVDNPAQVKALTAKFRDLLGRDAPVLVDQEGGRVQRLGPPHWPAYPPGSAYAALYDVSDRDRARGGTSRRPADR